MGWRGGRGADPDVHKQEALGGRGARGRAQRRTLARLRGVVDRALPRVAPQPPHLCSAPRRVR
jgi:hypothetical protein